MTKLVKTIAVIGAGLLLVAGGGTAALVGWLKKQVAVPVLVEHLESAWNVKASIDRSELNWSARPARLTIEGVTLRLPSEPDDPNARGITLDSAVLEIRLLGLLKKELDVTSLKLSAPNVREYVSPEGESVLEQMFQSREPAEEEQARVVPVAPLMRRLQAQAEGPELPDAGTAALEEPEFDASEMELRIAIEQLIIENGRIYVHNRESKVKSWLSDLHLEMTEIDVDPQDLEHHNQARLKWRSQIKLEGRAKVDGEMVDVVFADLPVLGEGEVQPFDPETGQWNPISRMQVTLAEGGAVGGYMTLGESGSSAADKLKGYGLDLAELPMGGVLQQDARFEMAMQDGKVQFLERTVFELPEYAFQLQSGGWVNLGEDELKLDITVVAGEELRTALTKGAEKQNLPDGVAESLFKTFTQEDGRLAFDLVASGQLTRPEIAPAWDKALNKMLNSGGLPDLLRALIN